METHFVEKKRVYLLGREISCYVDVLRSGQQFFFGYGDGLHVELARDSTRVNIMLYNFFFFFLLII